jgi:cellobiose dehydrogenase (acceptor)
MVGPLLLVSYPNGPAFTNSIRLASRKSSPPEATGPFKIVPIASGSYTNDTHWVSTFLCSGCITGDAKSFSATGEKIQLGWAVGKTAVRSPADANSTLTSHYGTQGVNIELSLAAAKSAKYGAWAALAKGS